MIEESYVGYKMLKCETKEGSDVAVAELVIPKDAMVYRPSGNPIEQVDLRCNKFEIRGIRSLIYGTYVSNGVSPHFPREYRVGNEYVEKLLDMKTNESCCRGLHFFATEGRAIEYALGFGNGCLIVKSGSTQLVEQAMKVCEWSLNDLLLRAVSFERFDIVKMAIDRGAGYHAYALREACMSGHPYADELRNKMKAEGRDIEVMGDSE